MKELINSSGKLIITFGPRWLAPYGSYMQFFCKIPRINIFFPESIVMGVRSLFRNDGSITYEESGLNKMSVHKFEKILSQCGFKIEYKKYSCVKGINFLSNIPFLRELFINRIDVMLVPAIK
jgi:hypothetical protein